MLPKYMVPSTVVCLDEWPRTSSGKIDRNALPAPQRADWIESSVEHIAPRTPNERAVADVWKALLGVPDVWVHDNFFELGGNSLRVMQMLPRLRAALGVGEMLTVASVFASPTVAGLCELLESQADGHDDSRQPPLLAHARAEGECRFAVSFAQEDMLRLDSLSLRQRLPWALVRVYLLRRG